MTTIWYLWFPRTLGIKEWLNLLFYVLFMKILNFTTQMTLKLTLLLSSSLSFCYCVVLAPKQLSARRSQIAVPKVVKGQKSTQKWIGKHDLTENQSVWLYLSCNQTKYGFHVSRWMLGIYFKLRCFQTGFSKGKWQKMGEIKFPKKKRSLLLWQNFDFLIN